MPVQLPVAPIPSDDPKKKKEKNDDDTKTGSNAPTGKATDTKVDDEELSEEDQALKNELEMLVERLQESDTRLYRPALEALRTLIRTSTSSMTSVPKPLKFLRPVYPSLQTLYETWPASPDKALFAEILSVLAMTYSDTQPRGTLKYRLLSDEIVGGEKSDPGSWGHEYVRHIAAELGSEYTARKDAGEQTDDLVALAVTCAKFLLLHNAEADAVDLLEELESISVIIDLVDSNTFTRVCTYMVSCVNFLAPPDDMTFLETAHSLYVKYSKFPEALALSIRLYNPKLIRSDFAAPANPLMKRQLAFIIARAGIPLEWVIDQSEDEQPEDLMECLCNSKLSTYFRLFGKDVGALEPKSLEDIYKTHLEQTRLSTTGPDSARANLAGTFVNAFVNAGFGNDKLMAKAETGDSWVYKNKDHGVTSAAASLGMCVLWDINEGLSEVDKYTYLDDEKIKGGALMATGMLQCNVRDENEAIVALLEDYIADKSAILKKGAIVGLGMAYVGTHKERVLELLLPVVTDETQSMEICSLAALSVGFTFVGSCNGDIAGSIVQALMERAEADPNQLDDKFTRFMLLGLGLLFIGGQDKSDVIIETLKIIQHPCSKQAQVIVEMCSFAGTSNVLNVQSMLHYCTEVVDKEKEKENGDGIYQAYAVMGIALTAMGEDVGAEMALRTFSNLMHYGEPTVRRSVPLALALLSASNPQVGLIDTLSKYSHDSDIGVAMNAILAMGFIGAGTNNARLAQMLRQLAVFYYRDPDAVFVVRVAQGLLHMGKGTIGINPFYSDRNIMSKNAIAGLLATLLAFSDAKAFILSDSHWMLFWLVMAMQPRFMMTLDENLEMLPVTVRVGQAVDVVGQAGKPRTISGFQTHLSPVRLGHGDRAELGTEEYLSFASVLEGLVILTKNHGWENEDSRMEL